MQKLRRKVRTTQSEGAFLYPNLLKGLDISYPDHVWCGDITLCSQRFYKKDGLPLWRMSFNMVY
jgi:hypothetical protein